MDRPIIKVPKFVRNISLPSDYQNTNITHHFYIRKQYMNDTILVEVDSLHTVYFLRIKYSPEDLSVSFTEELGLTLAEFD